ncbi:hypothetical protein KAS79_00835 [Candidatus Parcubacteria bacterium]|nr:hypothetical protein [Candidatus Parcubacteria bacterium]
METINVGIFGGTGRLGEHLVKILEEHSGVEIVYTHSRKKENVKGNLNKTDFIFLALPYGKSRYYLSKIKDKRIIDCSIDHRTDSFWIYGSSELNREEIKEAQYVANPGCYATSIILSLAPLKEYGLLTRLKICGFSSISGAGKGLKKEENVLLYSAGREHPQIKEIKSVLNLSDVSLCCYRVDSIDRGLTSVSYSDGSLVNIDKIYKKFYKGEPFIRLKGEKEKIETKKVQGTNFCDIKVLSDEKNVTAISALDNILKGGAGQAVQNFNIMYDFKETLGLL